MNRLTAYLCGTEDEVYYKADCEKLKESIPELAMVPILLIERMYSDFSDTYCAAWLIVDEKSIEDFRSWLL